MTTATQFLDNLNTQYREIHLAKEDLFWTTYMGTSDNHDEAAKAETAWNDFLSNSAMIEQIRAQIESAESIENSAEKASTLTGLKGWLATFEAHAIESEQAQALKKELIGYEAQMFEKKQNHIMTYRDENGRTVEGSLPVLGSLIRTSDSELVRQSAHQGLLDLEQWLLQNGFIELVKLRNRFARSQGYNTFFDYSVEKTEHMTTQELFTILEDFEQQTSARQQMSLDNLAKEKGDSALLAHNFSFSFAGDVMREVDKYVPFSKSLRRWVESFGRLNIDYSGAELTLDLLDRKGKYQNGFCHGPVPAFFDQGEWVAAKVNFTSNAKPDQVGSGFDGINTLFHEGGHAAHFANVKMNAPCFSQEFAPTSMAYAETQSMFCDSLLKDADWLKLYALDENDQPITDETIKAMIESRQPFKAYAERSILVVPYFERALYQLNDAELTPERITQLARETEKQILGMECSPRPLLSIPHLLSYESACSYQGYLLAHMAVYQTRAYLIKKFGYLTDNPNIGPLLAQHYWNKGNSVSHNQTIKAMTGEGFNAKYLADMCNLSVEQAWQEEQQKIASLKDRPRAEVYPLNAAIQVVDGDKVLATNNDSDDVMCSSFEQYIVEHYGR